MFSTRLTTVLSVIKTQNFTKSAEELNLTQPAVSQHIKSLENELDIKIFNRTQKEIKLTDEGKIVVDYAKRMYSLYQNLLTELEDHKRSIQRLTVGVTPTAESNSISQLLAIYCNENPKLHITIISDTIKNIYDKLKNFEIQLAIVEGTVNDPAFNYILLDTDNLVLAVSNSNPLSKKSMVTLKELKKEKLILRLPDSGTRTLFEQTLAENGETIDQYHIILEVDNNATIKELVQANFGVSILSKNACNDYLRKNKFKVLTVENMNMGREINIVYHKEFRYLEVLNDITKLYRDLVAGGGGKSNKLYKTWTAKVMND